MLCSKEMVGYQFYLLSELEGVRTGDLTARQEAVGVTGEIQVANSVGCCFITLLV